MQSPKLITVTRTFRSGYGARAIDLSKDGNTLFVGCKDGSIIAVDLLRAKDESVPEAECLRRIRRGPKSGIRWVYDCEVSSLSRGSLLAGDDLGQLICLKWDGEGQEPVRVGKHPAGIEKDWAPVTFIEDWDGYRLLVSYRGHDARLFPKEVTRGQIVDVTRVPRLKGVQGVCGFLRYEGRNTLLICEDGALWSVAPDGRRSELLHGCCPEPEQPGFVSDATMVSLARVSNPAEALRKEALYVSTDTGVYLLRWPATEADRPEIRKVHLPGISGMCMAVSYAYREGSHFLWVSDLAGDVRMFWNNSDPLGEAPLYWQSFGFRLESSQVVRSIARSGALERNSLVIGQACRHEKIVVTWYGLEPLAAKTASYLLVWGKLAELNQWQPKIHSPELEWESWCLEAKLALCIEEAGVDAKDFAQFLASPQPERLAWEILETLQDNERARRAVVLWTDSLLGTIHRRLGERREQQSLGVARWLRRLNERFPRKLNGWMIGLPSVIEDCIRHARKWGVFGGTYSRRKEVFAPLAALQEQQIGDRQLDSIAYQTLLFGRKVDVEDEQPEDDRKHLIPWDVRCLLSLSDRVPRGLIAVSWGEGGIDLYRIEPRNDGVADFVPRLEKLKTPELFQKESATDREHSRSIILGPRETPEGPGAFILRCVSRVASGSGTRPRERFELSVIVRDSGMHVETLSSPELPPGESVYTLGELEAGLVVVGLRGRKGSARLGLLRIGVQAMALLKHENADGRREEFLDLPTAYPELRNINFNPVWSLGVARAGADHEVVAGCGDGQIWKVRFAVDEHRFRLQEPPVLIGRMSSPVRALSYVPGRVGVSTRVIAGAADGTIVAFQRLQPRSSDKEKGDREIYTTLWATREEGAISRIHSFEAHLSSKGEKTPLVLVVTQNGMAVLFSNRESVETLTDNQEQRQRLRRLHVPGERLGRFRLGATSFASLPITGPEDDTQEAIKRGRVVRVLTATGEGTLRLLTLHYPKYTALRRDEFRAIRDAWMQVLRGGAGENAVQGHLLRRAESLVTASSHVSALLARWILWPGSGTAGLLAEWRDRQTVLVASGVPGPARQWVPRHLQPLIDLDAAWTRLRSAKASERSALTIQLSESLTKALKAARRIKDIHLFKEIIEVTLNRANHELFSQMMAVVQSEEAAPEIHSDWYLALLGCLVSVKSEWLGAPEDLDTRMRIVIVRNLVDGDTLWSLSRALSRSQARVAVWGDEPWRLVQQLIDSRVEQIHGLFAKGDPVLSLEVLRAVNLSFTRACRRMAPEEELDRAAIEGYYQAVGDFACRAVHSSQSELGEALTHEICRTYALGMLVCSSSTLRLTHRMTEADLTLDLARRVQRQFDLLEQVLERVMPRLRARIFEIVSGLEAQREGGHYKNNLLTFGPSRQWIARKEFVGRDNRDLVQQWRLFERIVDWLYQLSDQFSNEADDVELGLGWAFLAKCKRREADRRDDPYCHSRKFWQNAFEDLCQRSGFPQQEEGRKRRRRKRDAHESRPHSVRPSLVLFSSELSGWCVKQRKELDELKKIYQIFEPQRVLYDHALLSLERAAAGFRRGAALQKNMVLGVLGHGLLEMLDEHLLGLWEVAQTLDPERTWQREDKKMRTGVDPRHSRAARFADDMLNTAVKAEVIPKNLRNLQWLLCYRSGTDPLDVDSARMLTPVQEKESRSLNALLDEFVNDHQWDIRFNSRGEVDKLEVRDIHFLRFILNELLDNEGHNPKKPKPPSVSVDIGPPYKIRLEFQCDPEKYERLREVKQMSGNLQKPVSADPKSCTRSHGMGLYLANLAAAAIGWKLEIGEFDGSRRGFLPFELSRKG